MFRIPEEQARYEVGSAEYGALQDLSVRIDQGFREREAAREEAQAKTEQLYDQWVEQDREYREAYQRAYGV